MRACIHRGAHEIGGTCVEIESHGKRLVLDVGLPLDSEAMEVPLPPVRGFEAPDESLMGVVISHPHQDHFGLAGRLPASTPFVIGAAAERILRAAAAFMPVGATFEEPLHLVDRKPLALGPFRLTPYLVDHSAYDAYAILVEADGQRMFYSGDFRGHGRKGRLLDRIVADPPQDIDVLLMEGSTIGRTGVDAEYLTEGQLEDRFASLIDDCGGMSLVCCSAQNIDRMVTVYRACKRAGRQFIIDGYAAHILLATENPRIMRPDWDGIRVFWPRGHRIRIKEKRAFHLVYQLKGRRIYPEQLAGEGSRSVMLFRPSMAEELERHECLADAQVLYSMWSGYLRDDRQKPFLAWLERLGIPLTHCHTSGHAPVADLRRLAAALAPRELVPIHSYEPERFGDLFDNVVLRNDGQWWEASSAHGAGETNGQ